MSFVHLIIPLDIAEADPNFDAWFGQEVPHGLSAGRYPTPNEIIETINKFSEYEMTQSLIPYRELTVKLPSTGQLFTIESRYFLEIQMCRWRYMAEATGVS